MTAAEINKIAYRDEDPALLVALPECAEDFSKTIKGYAFQLFDNNTKLLIKRAGSKQAIKTPFERLAASNLAAISILGVALLRQVPPESLSANFAAIGVLLGEPNTLKGLKSLSRLKYWDEGVREIREDALQRRQNFDEMLAVVFESMRQPMADSPADSFRGLGFKVTYNHFQHFEKALLKIEKGTSAREHLFYDMLLVNRFVAVLDVAHGEPCLDSRILKQLLFGEGQLSPALLSGWTQNLPELIDALRNFVELYNDIRLKPFIASELAAQDCIVHCLRTGRLLSCRNTAAIADLMSARLLECFFGKATGKKSK